MTGRALRLSGAVLAGLAWLFVARLGADLFSQKGLTPVWFAPPVVVFALRLPHVAALVCLALTCLLHDATLAIPFGITASIALPAAAVLLRFRHHLRRNSRAQAAAGVFALTPGLHLAWCVALSLTGRVTPHEPRALLIEIAASTLLSTLATPWLADLTDALLHRFDAKEVA